jgi:carboxylesterase type B
VVIAYTAITAEEAHAIPVPLFQPILDIISFLLFTCPAQQAEAFRISNNVPAWRYLYYRGNYSNTYLKPLGSNYHTSELPVLFGTAANVTGILDSTVEADVAKKLRNAWAAFAKDPIEGLASLNWPQA